MIASAPSCALMCGVAIAGITAAFLLGGIITMVAALREAGMLSEDLITHPMHDDQEVH